VHARTPLGGVVKDSVRFFVPNFCPPVVEIGLVLGP